MGTSFCGMAEKVLVAGVQYKYGNFMYCEICLKAEKDNGMSKLELPVQKCSKYCALSTCHSP